MVAPCDASRPGVALTRFDAHCVPQFLASLCALCAFAARSLTALPSNLAISPTPETRAAPPNPWRGLASFLASWRQKRPPPSLQRRRGAAAPSRAGRSGTERRARRRARSFQWAHPIKSNRGCVVHRNRTGSGPTLAEEPRDGGGWRRAARETWDELGVALRGRMRGELAKAAKVRRGGKRINGADRLAVSFGVGEHVNECATDRTRGAQGPAVPPGGNEASPSEKQAIDPSREAHREAAHSLDQRAAIARFDDEVEVIGLHGVVDNLKSSAGVRRRNRAHHGREHELRAQRLRAQPHRHVLRNRAPMRGPRAMRRSPAWQCLAPGTPPPPAPTIRKLQLELHITSPRHHCTLPTLTLDINTRLHS
jgi:hypothetical protein